MRVYEEVALAPEVSPKRVFRKGLLFAWIPLGIFLLPLVINLVRVLEPNKATGLGAVAGGVSESLALLGFISFIASEIYAVAQLVKAYPDNVGGSKVLAIITIVISTTFTGMFLIALLLMLGHPLRAH